MLATMGFLVWWYTPRCNSCTGCHHQADIIVIYCDNIRDLKLIDSYCAHIEHFPAMTSYSHMSHAFQEVPNRLVWLFKRWPLADGCAHGLETFAFQKTRILSQCLQGQDRKEQLCLFDLQIGDAHHFTLRLHYTRDRRQIPWLPFSISRLEICRCAEWLGSYLQGLIYNFIDFPVLSMFRFVFARLGDKNNSTHVFHIYFIQFYTYYYTIYIT